MEKAQPSTFVPAVFLASLCFEPPNVHVTLVEPSIGAHLAMRLGGIGVATDNRTFSAEKVCLSFLGSFVSRFFGEGVGAGAGRP